MKHLPIANHIGKGAFPAAALFATFMLPSTVTLADEAGVSFWLPGTFGSLAAVPQQAPGWALATVYYHTSVSAGGAVALAREFEAGRIPANLTASLNANLNATGDLAFVAPSYTFGTPVLGGQAAVSMATIFGRTTTSLAGDAVGLTGNAIGRHSVHAIRQLQRFSDRFWRLVPASVAEMEPGRQQFHDLLNG